MLQAVAMFASSVHMSPSEPCIGKVNSEPDPTQHSPNEMTPSQRACLVTWWICHGERVTTKLIAERFKMSLYGTRRWMNELSIVLPIYCERGVWCVCFDREAKG